MYRDYLPRPKREYHLKIAGEKLPIDWPTYTFEDSDPGYDAYVLGCTKHAGDKCHGSKLPWAPAKGLGTKVERWRPRRVGAKSLAAAQAVIRQMVVHIDGCLNAQMCFDVLHNERGLSCHLILDNNGILYQTLDLFDCAYHAAGLNETSIGIEICNRGNAKKDPGYYDDPGKIRREVVTCTINGHLYAAYDFTAPQLDAMAALGRALSKHLPNIKLGFPQEVAGTQSWNTMPGGALAAQKYSGWLGHYHLTEQKWDPGPFDFKKILSGLAGRRSFPVGLHPAPVEVPAPPAGGDARARTQYERSFERYHDNAELLGHAFFPVGPLDQAQLYHGGVHLHVPQGAPVVAPFGGRLIAARNGPPDPEIGSTSFVLLAHNLTVGRQDVAFWTLLYHLDDELVRAKKDRPHWMSGAGWDDAQPNELKALTPAEVVQGGDMIGHVGIAGPEAEAQLHWEIFTVDHRPIAELDTAGYWTLYSKPDDQRFCEDPKILALVERKRDGIITPEELEASFQGDLEDRLWARRAATYHYSEWSDEPSWATAIMNAPMYRKRTPRVDAVQRMVERQILPGLWWTSGIAKTLGLPGDARVYTYHPVSFLRWINDQLGAGVPSATRKATQAQIAAAQGNAKLDIDDREGESMIDAKDLEAPKPEIPLEIMADGYGD